MTTIAFGDRVIHKVHPEWGGGAVIKVENTIVSGEPAPRITVRFSNAGLKIFSGLSIPLTPMDDGHTVPGDRCLQRPAIAEVEDLERSGLTQAVEKKILEIMLAIPLACRDKFNTPEYRLKRTLELYKYDMSGRGLMEWAIVQTGMDDPLTRFNRGQLEEYFKRWVRDRDSHLHDLLREMQDDPKTAKRLMQEAPDAALRVASL
ncbi:MAG: DUF3553 domain-containing protein [Phycisphaerales bacterium]|jgi:hypothetical protein|nr:DUF3553 domain-containing protein [Phycisphaerales bacterium]